MPPKKKDGKKKAAKVDDRPGQQPEALLETYTAFCKKIGLPPNAEVIGSLSNEENPNKGKQIIVGHNPKSGQPPLGPGGCRALATAIMGIGPGMPKDPETGRSIIYEAIQEIRIWGANVGDDGAAAIAELLRLGGAEIKLAYLELNNNNITEIGAFALGRSLQRFQFGQANLSLVTLNLDYNTTLGTAGVAALCLGLRTNSTLKKLSLRYCNIDGESGGPLGEVLFNSQCGLNILDIQGNRLGAPYFEKNENGGTVLDEDGEPKVASTGLLDLCPGLSKNQALTTLILADNLINTSDWDAEGLVKLAESIAKHPTLTSVDLLYNRIAKEKTSEEAEFFKTNTEQDPWRGVNALLAATGENGNKNISIFRIDASVPDVIFTKLNKMGGGGKKGKKKGKKCDRRLKKEVVLLVEQTDDEPALYSFKYKTDGEMVGRTVGVMAQDLLNSGNEHWASQVEEIIDPEDGRIFVVDSDFVEAHSRYGEFVK
ncbi:hypothetical protein TrCOL_g1164 [Triparma columacea]|uniref:Uncharacterized protein n=1 Tax=Triparma columacea TaxID=722753 RepID=A0A9W7GJQ2_9STRA|nr:hypothetical protein TrCOL_g1164 [Triparma columacea]